MEPEPEQVRPAEERARPKLKQLAQAGTPVPTQPDRLLAQMQAPT
jgi:hypothetical protein